MSTVPPGPTAASTETVSLAPDILELRQVLKKLVDLPEYDKQAIEKIFTWHTFRHNFSLWWEAMCRFKTIIGFFFHIMAMAWWDRQIWSYVGQGDIEAAQSARRHRHGHAVMLKLLELGPTFIKVGQSLSTRVDLLRKEYIDELTSLQDKVPPFDLKDVLSTIEAELGSPAEALFKTFDTTPLAAASLGQVHRVTLHTGEDAVIKVQRPLLIRLFEIDIAVLKIIAAFLQKNTELGRGREWSQIVDEFGRTLFEEIDYIQEGRSADHFRRNFAKDPKFIIPKIYWAYTARRVITLEYKPGIKINDLEALEAMGFSRAEISVRLVRAYFQQLLMDGFFHADPHPGNIVVDTAGHIVLYDFGMVGFIQEETRLKMVNTFLNIVGKRTDAILKNLTDLNMVTAGADMDEIRTVVDWALENYYDVPHDQLNFEELAEEMAEVMYYYPFKLPASFTFMFRALITLEGVATTLHPHIQFMSVAVEYAQDFVKKTYLIDRLLGPDGGLKNIPGLLKEAAELLGLSGILQSTRGGVSAQKVRLYYDEWRPLGRYIKTAAILLALGQTLIFAGAYVVAFLWIQHQPWPMEIRMGILMAMSLVFIFYTGITLTALTWLPSYKKPRPFNPPMPKIPVRHTQAQSVR